MPAPSRDRLARPVDISTLFRSAARRVDLVVDEPGLRWVGLARNSAGVRRVASARSFHRSPAAIVGRRSVLPHWHPRTPLRDITAIVGAIERRREQLRVDETTAPSLDNTTTTNDAPSVAVAQQEDLEIGHSTPLPSILMKPQQSPTIQAVKIMDVIALTPKENRADWDALTPEKKLLNSIEKVREVWVKERCKLERTPAAKRAERERKVRVLMSMR